MQQIIQKRFPMIYFVTMHKEMFRTLTNITNVHSLKAFLKLFVVGLYLTPIRWYRDMCSGEVVIDCVESKTND